MRIRSFPVLSILSSDLRKSLDSLDMVEITMELEERFNISIEDEEIANVKTVSDIVELVVAKKVD